MANKTKTDTTNSTPLEKAIETHSSLPNTENSTPPLADVVPATNIPTTREVVEVVIPNEVVLHRADSEAEAQEWANINLDYRYKVTIRPSVV